MMLIASSQPAEREAPGEPRVPWPRAPGPPCFGILLAGFQPWRAPLRLRCAAGLSRRRPAGCGNASAGNASIGSYLGTDKGPLLPGGPRGILVLLHLWVDFRPGLKEQDFCYFVSGKTSCNVSPVS